MSRRPRPPLVYRDRYDAERASRRLGNHSAHVLLPHNYLFSVGTEVNGNDF